MIVLNNALRTDPEPEALQETEREAAQDPAQEVTQEPAQDPAPDAVKDAEPDAVKDAEPDVVKDAGPDAAKDAESDAAKKAPDDNTDEPAAKPGKRPLAGKIFSYTLLSCFLLLLFIMYGPYKKISDLYITTFMHTSDHKYFATMLYSDEYIREVIFRNGVTEMEGVSDNIYSLESSGDIEVHPVTGIASKGWVLIVNDPKRVRLVRARGEGELLEKIIKRNNAVAGINASGYWYKDKSLPGGFTVVDHELINGAPRGMHSFVAADDDNNLFIGRLRGDELYAHDYKDVIEFGPLLILNGEPCDVTGNGSGLAPRTAIGTTEDGKVIMLTVNGWLKSGSMGATLADVQKIMLEFGAVNAINLDGGSSSSMYYDGKIINSPCNGDSERVLPNAIIVV